MLHTLSCQIINWWWRVFTDQVVTFGACRLRYPRRYYLLQKIDACSMHALLLLTLQTVTLNNIRIHKRIFVMKLFTTSTVAQQLQHHLDDGYGPGSKSVTVIILSLVCRLWHQEDFGVATGNGLLRYHNIYPGAGNFKFAR